MPNWSCPRRAVDVVGGLTSLWEIRSRSRAAGSCRSTMLRPSQTWTSLALLGSSVVGAQAWCVVGTEAADAGVVGAQSDFSVNPVDPGARHRSSSGRPRQSVGASNTGSLNLACASCQVQFHHTMRQESATQPSCPLPSTAPSVALFLPVRPCWLSGIVLAARHSTPMEVTRDKESPRQLTKWTPPAMFGPMPDRHTRGLCGTYSYGSGAGRGSLVPAMSRARQR